VSGCGHATRKRLWQARAHRPAAQAAQGARQGTGLRLRAVTEGVLCGGEIRYALPPRAVADTAHWLGPAAASAADLAGPV